MTKIFILASSLETIEKRFSVVAQSRLEWTRKIVIFPGDETLIITQQNPKELTSSKFGMTPAWAKQPMNLINARAEGNKNPENDPAYSGSKAIFMKPAFKRPLAAQRCIVIADAFVEWSPKNKQYYLVYIKNTERPFGIAGLYDTWIHPDTRVEYNTFAIVTVPGNPLIHQLSATRMPVIIPKGKETDWLKPSNHLTAILRMLAIFTSEKMNAYPVSKEIEIRGEHHINELNPVGNRVYQETNPKLISQGHYHYGHKQKGAGGGTWRGIG
jgi:putative SOS response-associated peptidase YedK